MPSHILTIFVENCYGSLFTVASYVTVSAVASYVAVCLLYVGVSLLYVDQYGSNEVGASQLEVAQFLNTSLKQCVNSADILTRLFWSS